jgi:hypothetical protein
LYEKVHLNEDDIRVIQIDGPLCKVYVKFVNNESMMPVIQPIQGDLEFHHENGEISKVTTEIAGVGTRRVRVSTLPPEVTATQITNAISIYAEVKKIHEEIWSHAYRFKVKTGVRLVDISIRKHIPSHMKIEGHRALISYEGEPTTCFRCNEQGHQISECPRRRMPGGQYTIHEGNSWANRVKHGSEKAPPDVNIGTNTIPPLANGAEHQVAEHQSRSPEQYAHDEQDPMVVEHLPCSPADEAASLPDDVNKTDNNKNAMDDEGTPALSDTQTTCPIVSKWSNLLTTDSDTEHDLEKQGKKREKSTQPKDDKQEGSDSDDNTIDAGSSQFTKMPSPKRTKKIKVDREVLTSRERTRSQSRLKKPCHP